MPNARSTALLENVLKEIETRLAAQPDDITLRFDRARCLLMMGREDEARRDFDDVLSNDPAHVRALNALGAMILRKGAADEARPLFARAVEADPRDKESRTNLAYVLLQAGEFEEARMHYQVALDIDWSSALAHHGLAETLERLGFPEAAIEHRALGMANRPLTALSYEGEGTPVRVLLLGSAQRGNLVVGDYLDKNLFEVYALVMEHYRADLELPAHDLVFNSIGDADLCETALRNAVELLKRTKTPVINDPSAVLTTGRVENAKRLATIPDVIVPAIARFSRESLNAPTAEATLAAAGLTFPLLVRSPGYHTGDHFELVEKAADLAVTIAALPGDELLAIAYIDVRSPDGKFRKYRAMVVNELLYPLHLAVSSHWKVHYFSAEMTESEEHRAEDAAFLARMPQAIGIRAMRALDMMGARLGLDYGGIDFSLTSEGKVVLFEANASMYVPHPGPDEIWNYRRAPVQRIMDAVRQLMLRRAAGR